MFVARNPKIPYNVKGPKTAKEFFKEKDNPDFIHENVTNMILKDKVMDSTEIEVCFFTLCGFKCKFCWQDHDDTEGADPNGVAHKADQVIDYLSTSTNVKNEVTIHLIGGELIQDKKIAPYSPGTWIFLWKAYGDFCVKISEWMDKMMPDKTKKFILVTNLGFEEEETRHQLDSLIRYLDKKNVPLELATSWDPTGRPVGNQITSTFHKNLEYYKSRITSVTTVLTRQTIRRFLQDNNPYFEYLYTEGYPLDMDYFHPTENSDSCMPSDRELLEVFRYFVVKYPKLQKINNWIVNDHNPITCASPSKVTILPDGTMTTCRHIDYDQSLFNTPINKFSNANIVESYLTKKECLSCPYFGKCTLSCFLMHDSVAYTGREELDECLYKKLFKELEDGKIKPGAKRLHKGV